MVGRERLQREFTGSRYSEGFSPKSLLMTKLGESVFVETSQEKWVGIL
jgi:hypothetical protein